MKLSFTVRNKEDTFCPVSIYEVINLSSYQFHFTDTYAYRLY